MRSAVGWLAISIGSIGLGGGCGSVQKAADDARPAGDDSAPPIDAMVDAMACQPRALLVGGTEIAAQGWSIVMQPPATVSYAADYVRLETTTPAGATTSGQLLLNYPGAVETGKPFTIQVVMLVESVKPHNQFDSAAAIMGSFSQAGGGNDRGQMIYLDADKIGWADDTQSFTTTVANNAYHTYELAVDAGGTARVRVDGIAALARNGFVFNGALAIGDQTNDPNVDSVLRIRSVTKLCP